MSTIFFIVIIFYCNARDFGNVGGDAVNGLIDLPLKV